METDTMTMTSSKRPSRSDEWGRVIERHYGLGRRVTDVEIRDEIFNLARKHAVGLLDDFSEPLYFALDLRGAFNE
jgi:hypothetical protein